MAHEEETILVLPISTASRADVGRLLREVEALDSFLDELYWSEESKVLHTTFRSSGSISHRDHQSNLSKPQYVPKRTPICPLCKQSGRGTFSHSLTTCKLLPEED